MTLTYLDIVNFVLGDTNESPLTSTQFVTARGFHKFVKEAVNRALMDVANSSDDWPWLSKMPLDMSISSYSDEVLTDRKVAAYDFPENTLDIDWDSAIAVDPRDKATFKLQPISYEEWQQQASADVLSNRKSSQLGAPAVIYRLKNHLGFGLSPVPDKEYKIQFISQKRPELLILPSATLPFEDRYYVVLVNRARYYAWMFRENPQQAQQAFRDYERSLRDMKNNLLHPIFSNMRAV